jgi:hypothetical protein
MWFLNRRRTPTTPPPQNVQHFLAALSEVAPSAGRGDYKFPKPQGGHYGFVQLIIDSPTSATIHRLWTHEPGHGNGSHMLRTICDLADEHGVELRLKCLPIGRKPHPMSREQLRKWYCDHGFHGDTRKLVRQPLRTILSKLGPASPDSGL